MTYDEAQEFLDAFREQYQVGEKELDALVLAYISRYRLALVLADGPQAPALVN